MSNIYTAGPNQSWDQEETEDEDLNVTRELTAARPGGQSTQGSSSDAASPVEGTDRWRQDTQPVDGEAAIHPPPGGARPQG